jgi:hypothetical protein
MRRYRIRIALLIVYLLVIFFGGLRDKLILHPSTGAIRGAGAQPMEFVRSDGGTTDAFVARSPGCVITRPRPSFSILRATAHAPRRPRQRSPSYGKITPLRQ